jgi:hypothetical protein
VRFDGAVSTQRLAEYQDYYRARARRYAGDPLYPDTARAEAAMSAAMQACTAIEEMQQRVVATGLNVDCARALCRDQAKARAALYAETQETVRAQWPAEVLATIDSTTDAQSVAAVANAAVARNVPAATADEAHRYWWTQCIVGLENIEVYRTAVVPPRWRDELDGYLRADAASLREVWATVVAGVRQELGAWEFSEATAREFRHRREIPGSDAMFERRLAEHRTIVRGGA